MSLYQQSTDAKQTVDDPYQVRTSLHTENDSALLWKPIAVGLFVFSGSVVIGLIALIGITIAILISNGTFDPQFFLLSQMTQLQLVLFFSAVGVLIIAAAGLGLYSRGNTQRVLLRKHQAKEKRAILSRQVEELKSALEEQKQSPVEDAS